jgi:hypothetical protein
MAWFIVIPAVCGIFVHHWIFEAFGDGRRVEINSTGDHLLTLWDDRGGIFVVPALIALVVLLARRVYFPVAVILAVSTTPMTVLCIFIGWGLGLT